MSKMKSALALLLVAVSGNSLAQVNALPPTRHILVYGDAQARAIPDRFKIKLEFDAVDVDADIARRSVEANVSDMLAKLKQIGVPDNEIVATSLQVATRQRYDQKLQEQVFLGTGVSRSMTARFPAQKMLEAFLAQVKTSKELRISDVSTELSDEAALRKELRQKSIQSTREKADVIAKAFGARLDGLYSVSDVAPQFEYGIQEGSWPTLYQWNRVGQGRSLDRIEVTGSRISATDIESFQTGYVDFEDRIYAVFLLED